MAGFFTDYYKIITPNSNKESYVPVNMSALQQSNINWYQKVMKGATSRFQQYQNVENMDSDVFVARALDTVAEEMAAVSSTTGLPFDIVYQNEIDTEVSESLVSTLRAALRYWVNLHGFDNSMFDICRHVIKYGDVFFKKTSDHSKWEYVPPKSILGVIMGEDNNIQFYQLRAGSGKIGSFTDIQLIPANAMIHFSLSTGMDSTAPFGQSILQPAVKAFRHLTLLEDAVIIYRIVRAPERRVFTIDTGNMPPQRARAYLESVKTEFRQKRAPSLDQQNGVDSGYNPISITEDFFLTKSSEGRGSTIDTLAGGECLSLDTKIKLLDGRDITLQQMIDEYNSGKINWVYSCHPTTGNIVPGKVTWAGITRKNTNVMKLTFDNNESVIVTPDHKFPIKDVGFVEAKDLQIGQSMIPLYTKKQKLYTRGKTYEMLFQNDTAKWIPTHRMVAEYFKNTDQYNEFVFDSNGDKSFNTVHHANFNRFDNSPDNLVWMNYHEHLKYHASFQKQASKAGVEKMKWYKENDPEKYNSIIESGVIGRKQWLKSLSESDYVAYKTYLSNKCYERSITKFNDEIWNIIETTFNNEYTADKFVNVLNNNEQFVNLFDSLNKCKLSKKRLVSILKQKQFDNWIHYKDSKQFKNHKLIAIEYLDDLQDTGTITVDGLEEYHDYHTFALSCGVFTKNSLGEINDLVYFQNRLLQGLRIPSSYMRGSAENGLQVQDGKVGMAYIEELRFANYVSRLQQKISTTFEHHFKIFLKSAKIKIDHNLFKIKLPDPQNFKAYREAELNTSLINNFNSIKDTKFISPRFAMRKYLNMTEEEIQLNEALVKQERDISDTPINEHVNDLRLMYDPAWLENMTPLSFGDDYNKYPIDGSKPEESEDDVTDTDDMELPPSDEVGESGEVYNPETGSEKPEDEETPQTDNEETPEPEEETAPESNKQ